VDPTFVADRRRTAATSLTDLISELAPIAQQRLPAMEAVAFLARLEHVHTDAYEALEGVYGDQADPAELLHELVLDALDAASKRPEQLRILDRRREIDPGWFQRARMIGYVCYADRFADTLAGVGEHLDYLAELGVTYLHLMPLLKPRGGDNDGGYAVCDYDAIDPRLGDMADFEALATRLHERGLALCIDFVLNHTAREHEWAVQARAGAEQYRGFYAVYPDRSVPDTFERTLTDVFPTLSPGNFSYVPEMGGWIWTRFRDFQWDLDYTNPDVLRAMLATAHRLANHGADVIRLDAVPFLWKRVGTSCLNQPEAHLITQVFRALTRLAAPGVLLKAEAIVEPDQLAQYLGGHDRFRPECDLAYDNQLMVMLWSTLATRDARLAVQALSRKRPAPPPTSWVTYVRCHDDIGWAVSEEDAQRSGLNAYQHRGFLNDYYSGQFPGSFARGALFGENPATGDARISGAAASLCGIEAALASGDPAVLDMALRRLETLYSVAFSFGGIPLIYMGDEIALRNDPQWRDDPAHAEDNRWMHRPPMSWDAAARRFDPTSVEGRAFQAMQRLVVARRSEVALRAGGDTAVLPVASQHVLAYRRVHARSASFLALANFSDHPTWLDSEVIRRAGIHAPRHVHSTLGSLTVREGTIELPAWGFVWIVDESR
jgi:amylosucrase